MSKTKKNQQKGFSTLNLILVIQLIVILALSIFITIAVSNATKQNTIEHLGAISDERAQIVKSYVSNCENTLRAFSKAKQVTDLLEYSKTVKFGEIGTLEEAGPNADVKKAQKEAQKFTTEFGNDVENLEGLWIGSWETHVLTHTNDKLAGAMQTRKEGSRQAELQNAMEAGDRGLYDAGFIISPGSGKQCISMYQAVYDAQGSHIGFAGLGIYTSGVIDTLNSVPIRGVENSTYTMIDAATGNYIFGISEELMATPTEEPKYLELIERYKNTPADAGDITDSYTFNRGGKNYVAVYTYIPEYKWLLIIEDQTSEAFRLRNTMIIYLGIFGIVILSLIIVFNIIAKRQEKVNQKLISTIAKNNMTKKSLNTAMFNDVLTGVSNRISFSINAEKMSSKPTDSRYFVMFNIADFSEINTTYGNDAGDTILVHTVNILREFFPEKEIYRTGSDEFIVVVPTDDEDFRDSKALMDKVNIAFRMLVVPVDLDNGSKVYTKYKIAAVKKTGGVDSSMIAVLKDMTNKTGEATYGMIDYREI
ncbi:MAG: diguanylate cyclase [Oscillospiraceae bacterium]|nr:diguanylate cyclase [Oscillospiraceae bacterium]